MSNHPPPPSEPPKFNAIQRHPGRTAIIAFLVFVAWTLPVAISQSWPAFVRDKTIPEWLAERRWPGMTLQVHGWLTIILFFVLAMLMIVAIITSWRRKISPQSTPTTDTTTTDEPERIKELETARTADARTIEQQRIQIERLQQQRETQSIQISSRDGELNTLKTKYGWLHEMADAQAKNISDYVEVERVYLCYRKLTETIPYIVFGLDIYNKSVFDITIEDEMKGHIKIAGKPLLRDKQVIYNPGNISPSSKGSLTIEQRLSPEEATLIDRCENDALGAFFYFDKLNIAVKGGANFPQVDRKQLILPEHICTEDQIHTNNWRHYEAEVSALESERDSLKAELEERDKNKLVFEIDTGFESSIILIPNRDVINYEGLAQPIVIDDYIIKAFLFIRFRNKDVHKTTVDQMRLSLLRRVESEIEREVPIKNNTLDVYPPNAGTATINRIYISNGIPIGESELTLYYQFHYHIEVDKAEIEEFSSDYFLRLTMVTISQQTYSLDIINIDWQSAFNHHIYVLSQNVGSMPSS